jgi:hypothetical protein
MSSPRDVSTTQRVVSSGLALGQATGRARRGPRPRRTASGRRSASGEATHLVIVRAHEPERKWLSADLTSWCPQGDWASSATGCRGKGRTKVSKSNYAIVEDLRIGVRLKISALWIAILFLFAYGYLRLLSRGADRGGHRRRGFGGRDHGVLPVRSLGLHRDRKCDGLPIARPAVEGQPVDQHRIADLVHRLYRGFGYR